MADRILRDGKDTMLAPKAIERALPWRRLFLGFLAVTHPRGFVGFSTAQTAAMTGQGAIWWGRPGGGDGAQRVGEIDLEG